MSDEQSLIRMMLRDVTHFAAGASGVRLRRYQTAAARAIVDSALHRRGLTFVVVFPRQSGKNELQAQIEAYLLRLLSERDAEIVKISPTWKPQAQNAMRRLERVLERNLLCRDGWEKENGYIYRIGRARMLFLSGEPHAHIVGATASTLLEVDEAQDVLAAKYDKDIAPMAASTNATRVFWGTAWTAQTLLARELRAAREAEARDGVQRVFWLTADDVAREVPAYGDFVAGQVARLGHMHPMVRSQFFSEEIDAESGLFPAARQGLMMGDHPRLRAPRPGSRTALLLDVGGEGGQDHDASALTVVEVDLSRFAALRGPVYRVVERRLWTGLAQTALFEAVKAQVGLWQPHFVVVDATGIGAGLASFLQHAFGERVLPFVFSAQSKSDLGWAFLSLVETGRFKDWRDDGSPEQALFRQQMTFCQMNVADGPGRLLRWGVPDGSRDPASGEPLHDDLLLSAALCAVLEKQPWGPVPGGAGAAPAADPLAGMSKEV